MCHSYLEEDVIFLPDFVVYNFSTLSCRMILWGSYETYNSSALFQWFSCFVLSCFVCVNIVHCFSIVLVNRVGLKIKLCSMLYEFIGLKIKL